MALNTNALVQKKELWLKMSKFWSYVHWGTGILGVCMSTLAAAGDVAGEKAPVYSVIAAICFGIIGFANPQKQSTRYVRGYLLLEEGLLKYDSSLISIDELFGKYERAESAIHEDMIATIPKPVPPANVHQTN